MTDIYELVQPNQILSKIFKNCPERLINQMTIESYKSKKILFHQGDLSNYVYIIVSGTIKRSMLNDSGREVTVKIDTIGGMIGSYEVCSGEYYRLSAQSMTDVEVIKIPQQTFLEWRETDTNFSKHLLIYLCGTIDYLLKQTAKFSLSSIKSQVVVALLELHNANIKITSHQVCNLVNSSTRSVYRVINELVADGLIEVKNKQIYLLNVKKLKSIVNWLNT
ncbi:hypothetical protein CBF34_07860 [Vagococcus penaei]|uniref:Uncharacterized protein n=1 Tax=Vagococcus penaei TaxID=633807 RepID=A0A1Q2D4C1_9ENTE|nr:Crp/Fnr family transcriptional regulator [Vagococcus penaei]AQP53203.1 hypothetical protein BW732_02445 [Vagococcus penaei]RSU01005.1 hypothetical protein CBF34_07860 [Vagococcus penaei]